MTHLLASQGDITQANVDAVVNAANSSLLGGSGVDGAIHRAGGPQILAECRAIVAERGSLPAGEAVITTGGKLPAPWVIHTVGPVWSGRDPDAHDATLASCYRASLDLAAARGLRSVAFPNISTGVYRFPKDRAATVATGEVRAWVQDHPGGLDRIEFVCFERDNYEFYDDLIDRA